ncbi:hypothetical protein AWH56_015875 [Anaerobacillus isosaccharinicus]|uniref:Bacterial transcriptional activator domain-containing protein n=1 Tax=Anaerobacillus isosaccharinicus TaxID=1532552 RepID=A0A1S2M8T0_9BACI|nr:hypothetical protein [Anaerobacillus isosaccharinicus]MBA5587620.1 hypothetical protein [Anaerobacillus isosaccharinicus]QOY34204.1 hypothetical protein AWH56_015875 [Anaerobacillus isosaccharinicus]
MHSKDPNLYLFLKGKDLDETVDKCIEFIEKMEYDHAEEWVNNKLNKDFFNPVLLALLGLIKEKSSNFSEAFNYYSDAWKLLSLKDQQALYLIKKEIFDL